MSEEENDGPTINIAELQLILQAVELAQRRGAFTLTEAGQLAEPTQNLTTWAEKIVKAYGKDNNETKLEVDKNNDL